MSPLTLSGPFYFKIANEASFDGPFGGATAIGVITDVPGAVISFHRGQSGGLCILAVEVVHDSCVGGGVSERRKRTKLQKSRRTFDKINKEVELTRR